MAERDEPFLRRWSRRKRAGGAAPTIERPAAPVEPEPAADALAPEESEGAASPSAPARAAADAPVDAPTPEAEPVAPEDLPDIDSLGPESDYTPFLKKGVPEHLARRALRKLWRSDPVLANLDGLNDYDEDFAKPFLETAGQTIKTWWTEARDAADRVAREADEGAAAPEADAPQPSPAGEGAESCGPSEESAADEEAGPAADADEKRRI